MSDSRVERGYTRQIGTAGARLLQLLRELESLAVVDGCDGVPVDSLRGLHARRNALGPQLACKTDARSKRSDLSRTISTRSLAEGISDGQVRTAMPSLSVNLLRKVTKGLRTAISRCERTAVESTHSAMPSIKRESPRFASSSSPGRKKMTSS